MMMNYHSKRRAKQAKVHERLNKLGLGKKYKNDDFRMMVKEWFITSFMGISSESTKQMSLSEMQDFLDITDGFENYDEVLQVLELEVDMSIEKLKEIIKNDLEAKKKQKRIEALTKPLTDKQYWEILYLGKTLPVVFHEQGAKCINCGFTYKLGGHHLLGRERAYTYLNPKLILVLCEKCHSGQKSLDPKKKKAFEEYSLKLAEERDTFMEDLDAVLDKIGVDKDDFLRKIVPQDLKEIERRVRKKRIIKE
jgi:hypothetical protein